MPVPRLFEAASDSREQWSHVLASLLALTGPATRAALTAELAGEELPGAEAAQVRERARLGEVPVDLVVADPRAAVDPRRCVSSLAFDDDLAVRLGLAHDAAAAGARARRGGGAHPRPPSARRRGRGRRRRPGRAPPQLAAHQGLGAGAARARLGGGGGPGPAARGRVLPDPARGGALPAGGRHAQPAARGATGPGRRVLRPQRAGAGAAHRHRRGRGERPHRLPAHRRGPGRAGRRRPGPCASAWPRPPGAPGFAAAAHEGWSVLPIARPADYSAARGWIQDAARELLVGPR